MKPLEDMSPEEIEAADASPVAVKAHAQGQNLIVSYHQDVEPHMEAAAAARRADREERGEFGKRAEFRKVMSVPFTVLMEVARKLGIPASGLFEKEYSERIYAELKGPEYTAFRTVIDKRI